MNDHIEQAVKNYAREVRGRIATKVDRLFERREELKLSREVIIEVARFYFSEAADSVQPLLFLNKELTSLEDAKLFIKRAGIVRDTEVKKAIRHFEKRILIDEGHEEAVFYRSEKEAEDDPFGFVNFGVKSPVKTSPKHGEVGTTFRASTSKAHCFFVIDIMHIGVGEVSPVSYNNIINEVGHWVVDQLYDPEPIFEFCGKCRYGNVRLKARLVNNGDSFFSEFQEAILYGEMPTVVISKC